MPTPKAGERLIHSGEPHRGASCCHGSEWKSQAELVVSKDKA